MPKQRVSSVDIQYLVRELKEKCVNLRLANIYDVTPKVYMLKFAKPDHKEFVICETGVRIHTTDYQRSKPALPSAFVLKLRKHIRTWRLEKVEQLGVDRIIDFTFGRDEACYHLIFEFYAKGNMILCDHEYTILALLRTHKQDEDAVFAVKERYPVEKAMHHVPMTRDALFGLVSASEGWALKQLLNSKLEYGPALIENCLLEAELKPSTKIKADFVKTEEEALGRLLVALKRADDLILKPQPPQGFVYKAIGSKPPKANANGDDAETTNLYEHFSAFPLLQYENPSRFETQKFPNFNKAVDDYFSHFEDKKADQEEENMVKQKLSKVDKVRKDHEERIGALQEVQDKSSHIANLIISNAEEIEQAISVVRAALAQSMDWTELKRVVKEQKKQGNPLAMMIHDLKLNDNLITLLLSDSTDDAAEDDLTAPVVAVDVDINLSAYANARKCFDSKRKAHDKEEKTKAATGKALKSAQKRVDKEIKKELPTGPAIKTMRKPFWFEKFYWFITSENMLVISGRDAQQNEMLVKRYLKPGDIYVHADLHGASSCIIKNPSGKVVPPVSLSQAGQMCSCRSSAWNNKVITSSWWVYHNQVSKTAPTGEYLPTGSFMIRGKKNFLPPQPLIMGMGILYRVADEYIPNHLHERRPTDDTPLSTYHIDTMGDSPNLDPTTDASPAPSSVFSVSIGEEDTNSQGDDSNSITRTTSVPVSDPSSPATDTYAVSSLTDREQCSPFEGGEQERGSDEGDKNACDSESHENGSTVAPNQTRNDAEGGQELQQGKKNAEGSEKVNTNFSRYDLHQNAYDNKLDAKSKNNCNGAGSPHTDDGPCNEEDTVQEEKKEKMGRKRMSAKERRMLARKKSQNDEELHESKEEEQEQEEASVEPSQEAESRAVSPPKKEKIAPPKPLLRGQKGKLKKMAKKYADQDDEERELAMQLLGHKPRVKEVAASGRPDRSGLQAVASEAVSPPQSKSNSNPPEKKTPSPDEDTKPTKPKPIPKPKPQENEKNAADKQEVQALLKEEGIKVLTEEEAKDMDISELDALTGRPNSEETMLYAMPMCAPYSALQGFKYKVKIQPGSQKRGKAVQAAEKYFMHTMKGVTDVERQLLRNIDNAEMILSMMSNARVSVPGADAVKKDGKKGKK